MLAFVAPLMLLYSYNSEPKRKLISTLIPAVGILLMILVVLESIRKGAGMIMAGKQINIESIRQSLQEIVQ